MKLFFRVFLLIQLVTLPLRAQYMVQGVVTDSLTKEPLPYTSVYLKGTTEGGMTDNNGRFFFFFYPIKLFSYLTNTALFVTEILYPFILWITK